MWGKGRLQFFTGACINASALAGVRGSPGEGLVSRLRGFEGRCLWARLTQSSFLRAPISSIWKVNRSINERLEVSDR